MTGLAGRVALVTGASRGIGAAVAAALAREGAHVIRVARSLIESSGAGTQDIPRDLTDPGQVSRLGSRVIGQYGPPDIVVSNAGAFLLRALEVTEPADLEVQLAVNVRAPFYVAKAFLPVMRDSGRGSFISLGSVADYVGFPENAAYAASKYALRGLHETLVGGHPLRRHPSASRPHRLAASWTRQKNSHGTPAEAGTRTQMNTDHCVINDHCHGAR